MARHSTAQELDLGRAILWDVLKHGDIRAYLAKGWDEDWIGEQYSPTHTAVFNGTDVMYYQQLLRYFRSHGSVPSFDYFRTMMAGGSFDFPDVSASTEELVRMTEAKVNQVRIMYAANDLTASLELRQDWTAQLVILEKAVASVGREADQTGIREYFDDGSFSLADYLDTEILPGPGFGVKALDTQMPAGFQPGMLVSVIGRSKANKTTLAIISAFHAWMGRRYIERWQDRANDTAEQDDSVDIEPQRVLIVSTEIDLEGVRDRLLGYGAGVDPEKISNRNIKGVPPAARMSDRERARVESFWRDQVATLDTKALKIVQPTGMYTISQLEQDIIDHEATYVVFDGFYFLVDPETRKNGGNWEGGDALANGLKSLALKYRLPLLVTNQFREKQLGRAGGGIKDDTAMMGGTGLRMASDRVFTLDKGDDGTVTIVNTASRKSYAEPVQGYWKWDNFEFVVEEYTDGETWEEA